MPQVFWLGLGIFGFVTFIGLIVGLRSRTTRLLTALAIAAYSGLMLAFPLLAIGLSTA